MKIAMMGSGGVGGYLGARLAKAGHDVRFVARGAHPGYAEERLAFADSLPGEMKASMLHDLERGNPIEVGWLSGAVVRLGKAAGVPTPANRAAYVALKLHAEGAGR